MTMTPTQAITYLHSSAPTDPADIVKSKRYEALAALAPLIGLDLDHLTSVTTTTTPPDMGVHHSA